VAFVPLYVYANSLYSLVSEPIRRFLPEGATMIATEVASPFLTPLKLAVVASFFVSIPIVLYQAWRFVAPALYSSERRLALPLLVSSIMLFYLGMAFAYFVVFPLVFEFLSSAGPDAAVVMPDINHYLNFVLKMFFAFGVAFEIPVATVILVAMGMASTASLIEKRPYIIVGCFVVGMLLTPPDVLSQFLLAVPMWFLFECGVLFARVIERRREREADQDHPDPS
jgi:sec-independent protein translocase protein TatC